MCSLYEVILSVGVVFLHCNILEIHYMAIWLKMESEWMDENLICCRLLP